MVRLALLLCLTSFSGVHGSSTSGSSHRDGTYGLESYASLDASADGSSVTTAGTPAPAPTIAAISSPTQAVSYQHVASSIGEMSGTDHATADSMPEWQNLHADCMASCLQLCDEPNGACAKHALMVCAAESTSVEAHHSTEVNPRPRASPRVSLCGTQNSACDAACDVFCAAAGDYAVEALHCNGSLALCSPCVSLCAQDVLVTPHATSLCCCGDPWKHITAPK